MWIRCPPARWYRRKVNKGWQFGYSGGTQNDFVIDVEVARWRFVCFIGFKYALNPSPRQERHEQWRKEQELARKRANEPESALRRFWWALRGIKTPGYRVDQKQSLNHHAPPVPGQLVARVDQLRLGQPPTDGDEEKRGIPPVRTVLPEQIRRVADFFKQGILRIQERSQTASGDGHHPDAKGRKLPKEPNP